MTRPTAMATMQSTAICRATFSKLPASKKPSPRSEKNANIPTKAIDSGAAKTKSAARPRSFLSTASARRRLIHAALTITEMRGVYQIILRQPGAFEEGDHLTGLHDHRPI